MSLPQNLGAVALGVAACVSLVLIPSCSDARDTQRADVTVMWLPAEQIPTTCGPGSRACAVLLHGRCIVVSPRPQGWHDDSRVYTLGHELLHCLGWVHPRVGQPGAGIDLRNWKRDPRG